jgi:hypothetical protein
MHGTFGARSDIAMWYAYCFTLDTDRGGKDRPLFDAVSAFSKAVVGYFSAEGGHWVPATARAKNGGIEIWYSLPKLPADKPFNEFWRARLAENGLIATRVGGRT